MKLRTEWKQCVCVCLSISAVLLTSLHFAGQIHILHDLFWYCRHTDRQTHVEMQMPTQTHTLKCYACVGRMLDSISQSCPGQISGSFRRHADSTKTAALISYTEGLLEISFVKALSSIFSFLLLSVSLMHAYLPVSLEWQAFSRMTYYSRGAFGSPLSLGQPLFWQQ